MDTSKFTLPGVAEGSTLLRIYRDIKAGRVLTSLNALQEYQTVNLVKYLSILRLEYGVNIQSKWIDIPSKKRIKQYWIDRP